MSSFGTHIKAFLLPKTDRKFFVRLVVIVAVTIIVFGGICRPFFINGSSMHPTYKDGQFILGLRPKYWMRDVRRGDVVMVELAGARVMYLKRVVAFPGETVAFKDGQLYINARPLDEPYVNGPCAWNLPERTVDPGFVYVIGDNRSMIMESHTFGAVLKKRIYGGPLW